MSKEKGLEPRYWVERIDGKDTGWCFVLEESDPLAPFALRAYAIAAANAGHDKLAEDLRTKSEEIERERKAG